jgi:chromosome segregation ATPase
MKTGNQFAIDRALVSERSEMAKERDEAAKRIAALEKTNDDLSRQLKVLQDGKLPTNVELSHIDRQTINQVKSDDQQLQTRMGKLEEALETTPEKALSTVMLRQRLDTLQDRTRGDIDNIHGEIGRLYTLTQWFIGLIFTIALGMLTLAIGNLRKPKT